MFTTVFSADTVPAWRLPAADVHRELFVCQMSTILLRFAPVDTVKACEELFQISVCDYGSLRGYGTTAVLSACQVFDFFRNFISWKRNYNLIFSQC